VPEIIPFVFMALFKLPLALTVTQILAIDLGTDLLPALGLGSERPEPNVMHRPPRQRTRPLLDKGLILRSFLWLGLIETTLCYLGFFYVFYANGYNLLHLPRVDLLPLAERLLSPEGRVYILATTVFHAGVVAAQIGNAFACRTEKGKVRYLGYITNHFLLAGIAVEIGLILLLIYFPPLAWVFEHLPLPPKYWAGLALFAPILYILDWTRRWIVRRIEWSHNRD
jgi:magnesium-transporting ATPase (P-type)